MDRNLFVAFTCKNQRKANLALFYVYVRVGFFGLVDASPSPLLESPFPVHHFSSLQSHVTVLLSKKIACTRRYNRNAGINFDKKTRRYRDNSQGVWGRKEGEGERTESPKINGTVRHTAAGYDREIRAFKCKCNGPPRRSEDNRGRDLLLFTAIYFCAKQSFPPRRRCSIGREINTRRNLHRHPRAVTSSLFRCCLQTRAFRVSNTKNYHPIFHSIVNFV